MVLARVAQRFQRADLVVVRPYAGGQEEGTGGVDRRDARHPQDDHTHIGDLGRFQQEAVGGGEEQGPVDPARHDVLGNGAQPGRDAEAQRERLRRGDGTAGCWQASA